MQGCTGVLMTSCLIILIATDDGYLTSRTALSTACGSFLSNSYNLYIYLDPYNLYSLIPHPKLAKSDRKKELIHFVLKTELESMMMKYRL